MQWKFWEREVGELEEALKQYKYLDSLAARIGFPKAMYVCDHCGAAGWRMPPHMFEPCPIVLAMSEAAGLKIDAERATTIKAGIQMEEAFRMLQEMHGIHEEEDEE